MAPDDCPARQLTFDLARSPSYDPDDFLVSPSNAEAHAMIERWPSWANRTLLLVGPAGAGKSHLASIWAGHSGAQFTRGRQALDALKDIAPVVAVLEDADAAGHSEADFFHVLNLVNETCGWLVVTARKPPDQWGLSTPDLLSRLRLAALAPIGRPDAALMRAVLVKLFADRQILISEDVVAYAALHCEQSLDAVSRFVAAVDEESLASGRRITRPLAAVTLSRTAQATAALDD